MKTALRTALWFAIPFGLLMGAIWNPDAPVWASGLVGIGTAVATAIAIAGYALWRQRRFNVWAAKMYAPYAAEGIVQHCYTVAGEAGNAFAFAGLLVSPALAGRLSGDGLLVLTGQRLLFVPLRGSWTAQQLNVPLSEIVGVGPGYGFSGRSIRIGTRAQIVLHFKVDDRAKWMAALPGKRLPAPGADVPPATNAPPGTDSPPTS